METLLLDSANGKKVDTIPEVIAEYFHGKIDFERLTTQLLMLPDAITTAFAGTACSEGEGDKHSDHWRLTQPDYNGEKHAW